MIALVDCNNFFASCERLFRPDLKNKPVLVLSNNDGCVVARSNEVKALGIPMGVPYFKIREIAESNNVQCFSSNFALYSNISQRIIEVLDSYAPQVEVYSIDEAFLDISLLKIDDSLLNGWGDELCKKVQTQVGMPVSIGIAANKTLAKLAGNYAKTHQQTCVLDLKNNPNFYKKVLSSTAINDVWGIGRSTAPKLASYAIHNAWQLAQVSKAWIKNQLGINGVRLLRELRGETVYKLESTKSPQKSLMASRSFGHTIKNIHDLEVAVAAFASQAAYRLRSHQQHTSNFGVYLRYKTKDGKLKGQSAAITIPTATNDTTELVRVALSLLQKLYDEDYGYKKAGVFAGQLSSASICQVDLLDVLSPKQRKKRKMLMNAVDSINKRFGANAVHVAAIDPKSVKWKSLKQRMSPAYTTDWNQLPKVYQYK